MACRRAWSQKIFVAPSMFPSMIFGVIFDRFSYKIAPASRKSRMTIYLIETAHRKKNIIRENIDIIDVKAKICLCCL